MNYFAGFDRYVIEERNEGIGREMRVSRLEKRLREDREPNLGSWLASFVARTTLPLLRRAGLAG